MTLMPLRLALPRTTISVAWLLALAALFLNGCQTTTQPGEAGVRKNPEIPFSDVAALRPGDSVVITLQSIPDPASFDMQIDDKGMISLRYIGPIEVAGLTASQLSEAIRNAYINKQIYRSVDVSVSFRERFVIIGGEVRRPGPVSWTNDLTLTKAITLAGGFSLYARESAVQVTRDNKSYEVNADLAIQNPTEDVQLVPGDTVTVPRSPF